MTTLPTPRCRLATLAVGAMVFVLAALLLGGCHRASPDAPTLSTHQVPPARAEAIATAINQTLMQGDNAPWLGRAEVAAPGTLVVRAPASLQPSIAAAIAQLQGAETAAPVQLQVEAWWVTETADAAPLPADLGEVATTLGIDAGALRLRDRVELGVATGGRPANANGEWMLVSARAYGQGETFALDLRISPSRMPDGRVGAPLQYEGEVLARPGEFIVLTSRPNAAEGAEALVLRIRAD